MKRRQEGLLNVNKVVKRSYEYVTTCYYEEGFCFKLKKPMMISLSRGEGVALTIWSVCKKLGNYGIKQFRPMNKFLSNFCPSKSR